ncbi:hypothetical protein BC938DRAFT_473507 [Jimgerdemannia flammicorona]|uniref:Uncharacterized protein n=1 Tax=Jimgerdemannia flammicorona TaxID=994334 RepID=A0A433Q3X9_9FUNG|nr:hypothetical protein BC938DRAFT_473507 [Jimgerdemannia flammicorona]
MIFLATLFVVFIPWLAIRPLGPSATWRNTSYRSSWQGVWDDFLVDAPPAQQRDLATVSGRPCSHPRVSPARPASRLQATVQRDPTVHARGDQLRYGHASASPRRPGKTLISATMRSRSGGCESSSTRRARRDLGDSPHGISTTVLWRRLLEMLNGDGGSHRATLVGDEETAIILSPAATLQPPFDQRTPHHPTLAHLLPIVFKHMFLPAFAAKYLESHYWVGQAHAKKEQHHTLVRTFEVPREMTEKLAQKSSRVLRPSAPRHPSTRALSVTVSSRRPKSASFDRNCDFKLPMHETISDLKTNFWDHCRAYKTELSAQLVQSVKTTNLLRYVGEFPRKWLDFFWNNLQNGSMGRTASFEISDLGRWDVPVPEGTDATDWRPHLYRGSGVQFELRDGGW